MLVFGRLALLLVFAAVLLALPPTDAHAGYGGAAFDSRHVLEAEDYDAPWGTPCDPTTDSEHTEARTAASRSGGAFAFVPHNGCGLTFTSVNFPTGGFFDEMTVSATGSTATLTYRTDVFVDGILVATKTFSIVGGSGWQDITLDPVAAVTAGPHMLQVQNAILTGASWHNLNIDCIKFEETDTYPCLLDVPIADFDFLPDPCANTDTVTFTDLSIPPSGGALAQSTWDFGDGTVTSYAPPPPSVTHVYATAGTYTVTLTVQDDVGQTATATDTITVQQCAPPPVADFACTTMPTYLDVSFLDLSSDPTGTIVAWDWQFGDGGTASVPDPMHTYPAKGWYPVQLTVTASTGLSSSVLKNCFADLNRPPVIAPIPVQIVREGETVRFTVSAHDPDGDPITYAWWSGPLPADAAYEAPVFSWTTPVASAGRYEGVGFTVSDHEFTVGTAAVIIVLPPPPHPGGDEVDQDGDGVPDGLDDCPWQANPSQAGCTEPQTTASPVVALPLGIATPTASKLSDVDHDSVPDVADNCPLIMNPGQEDLDRDGLGDVCDDDTDGDGVRDVGPDGLLLDNCPRVPNPAQDEACGTSGAGGAGPYGNRPGAGNGPGGPGGDLLATAPAVASLALVAAALLIGLLLRRRAGAA